MIVENKLPLLAPFAKERGITRVSGITKSGFEPKELGEYAINPALDCECKCLYCSSHCVLHPLQAYRDEVRDWWAADTFVYYENILDVVGRDAARLGTRTAEVVISTVVDPYQSRLVRKGIPRAILAQLALINERQLSIPAATAISFLVLGLTMLALWAIPMRQIDTGRD